MALWTPSAISTALWLDASDSSTLFDAVSGGSLVAADGAVARWEDKSGNGRHATQGTEIRKPLRKAAVQNSLDVISFDGSNDYLATPASSPTFTGYHLFVVESHTGFGGASLGRLLEIGNNQIASFMAGAETSRYRQFSGSFVDSPLNSGTINTWRVLGFRDQLNSLASGISFTINGEEFSPGGTSATSTIPSANSTIHVGNRPALDRAFAGTFGEIVLFQTALAVADRQLVEGYLAWKWGLQANLPADHPYKNAAPTIGGGIIPILRQHYAAQGAR